MPIKIDILILSQHVTSLFCLVYASGLKLAARGPNAARRMITFGPRLRIKMKIFESIGMFLSQPFLRKT